MVMHLLVRRPGHLRPRFGHSVCKVKRISLLVRFLGIGALGWLVGSHSSLAFSCAGHSVLGLKRSMRSGHLAARRSPRLPAQLRSRQRTATGDQEIADQNGPQRRLVATVAIVLGFSVLAGIKRYAIDGGMERLILQPGSLKGRTIVITGGNTGLGLESAMRLAGAGATVLVTARTAEKGVAAVKAIKGMHPSSDVHYLQLDLADLTSVKAFPAKFAAEPYGDHIDILMNNAGVMAIPERQETKDGFERQFGTNHLGHFALVAGVLPLLRKAKGFARVINVSSAAQLAATKEQWEGDFMAPERYNQWGAYCQSKLANNLFTKELDRRFKIAGVQATAVSCHPGTVNTDLGRWFVGRSDDAQVTQDIRAGNPFLQALTPVTSREVDLGANTQIYLAAGADGGYDKSGGEYFDNMKSATENVLASDAALATDLWRLSENLTGVRLAL